MQIHELNPFAGAPGSTDYLAIDNGSETAKIPITEMSALVVTFSAFSSLPRTLNNAAITSDMVAIGHELSNTSAQAGEWTVTTSNGSVQVSGDMAEDSSTTLKLYLIHSR